MKKFLFLLLALAPALSLYAQIQGSFVVQGDAGKFYPVLFSDASWNNNKETEFDIGRSNVHTDGTWRGSLIAKFRIHTYQWGNGSNFIDATIRQFDPFNGKDNFIAGWQDATISNGNQQVVIWLQGGSNTYYYNSSVNVSPVVYDGIQNALPFQESNGPALSYKTSIDPYVNSYGENFGGSAYFTGGLNNYFANNVGIGTTTPDALLAVKGTIHAQEVKVDMTSWNDYVFNPTYRLPKLSEIKTYIDENHHLPDMPSEKEVVDNGIKLTEMLKLQQKKIEELTLYLIEKDRQLGKQQQLINAQQEINRQLQKQITALKPKPSYKKLAK